VSEHSEPFGRFSDDGREFVIATPRTPRHWYNYLWNDHFVSLFSQVAQGESLAQDSMGRRIELARSRMFFVQDRDTGAFWSAGALPVDDRFGSYSCTHGLGYSAIALQRDGLASTWRVFVPPEELCEIWTLTIENRSSAPRRLRLVPYVDAALGGILKPQAYYLSPGIFDDESQAAVLHSRAEFGGSTFAANYLMMDRAVTGYDTRHASFVGYGTEQSPDALRRACLGHNDCVMEKGILALEATLELAPDERAVTNVIAGVAVDRSDIMRMRERYLTRKPGTSRSAPGDPVEEASQEVRRRIDEELGPTSFRTGDRQLDLFASVWLKRQISLGTQWARVRHNGFRDYMQDIAALAHIAPETALVRLKRVLAFQYGNGYAPRTWLDGKILDRDFSDNHVWIPMTVHTLIMETGDAALLDMEVPFNNGTSASLYEHARRAVEFLWNDRALHDLCRIRSGDWNDCMERVGPKGEGTSVWLSMAWCLANDNLANLADVARRDEDAVEARLRGEEMKRLINECAWDGEYYLRAFADNGEVIGSHSNDEGRLYLNAQTWAVLGDVAPDDRRLRAIESAERALERDIGIVTVEAPYSSYRPDIGSMSLKLPGVQENGGVYLHASAFKLVADCILKRHAKVEEAIRLLLPLDKGCEPYVFSNCYYAVENSYRYGTPGQSWGTGTAGWFYVALLNHVFGLKPTLPGLVIDPCLPPGWKTVSVHRRFRGADYDIHFDQNAGYERIESITVNGSSLDGALLPHEPGAQYDVRVKLS
jgi:cellobiose phosphorylase